MSSRLIVERIATEEDLCKTSTKEDLQFAAQFGSKNRRCEVLAWRAIVRRELGTECIIYHDEYGAPKVDNPHTYISVSHSKDSVAVLFADRPCAVDIEQSDRNFLGVVSRYLSVEEQKMAKTNDIFAEMWCAKEALYKYHQKGNLDLVKDISITNFNRERQLFVAHILDSVPIEVYIKREENLVIATILS